MEPAHHLDASSTAVVTDSSVDVAAEHRPPNWRVVPIPVAFGSESFADGVDIDAAGFYERLARSDRLPTTSQPPTGMLTVFSVKRALRAIGALAGSCFTSASR